MNRGICDHPERFVRMNHCLKCGRSSEEIAHERLSGEIPMLATTPEKVPGFVEEKDRTALCGCRLVTEGAGPTFVAMCNWHRKHLG